jgi:hypothetical protein
MKINIKSGMDTATHSMAYLPYFTLLESITIIDIVMGGMNNPYHC